MTNNIKHSTKHTVAYDKETNSQTFYKDGKVVTKEVFINSVKEDFNK